MNWEMTKKVVTFIGITFFSGVLAQGAVIIGNTDYLFITDTGEFEGDGASDTAGPFTDAATSLDFTITTVSVTGTGSILNENEDALGVGDATFDPTDIWVFSINQKTEFQGIDFSSIGAGESATLSSPAWVGLSGVTPGTGVSFVSGTGTFTLSDGNAHDDFDLNDLTGGTLLSVGIGVDITIAGAAGNVGALQDFTVAAFVTPAPEPSTFGLIVIGGFFLAQRRKRLS